MTDKEIISKLRKQIKSGVDEPEYALLYDIFDDNYYGEGCIDIYGKDVEIESIWTFVTDYKSELFVHCCCNEFEGDLLFSSLAMSNQLILLDIIEKRISES